MNRKSVIGTENMIRMLFFTFAMMLVVVLHPLHASAAEIIASGSCRYDDSVKWELDADGILTISGSGYMDRWDGYENVYYRNSVKSVVIEDGITNIAHGMFKDCTSLTNVSIPDGVKYINSSLFEGCSSLKNITIPDSVTNIGGNAFEGCSSLTDITLPDGVTSIGSYAFSGCTSLVNVTGLKITSPCEFYGCTALKEIEIPDGTTEVYLTAFTECTNLVSIKIPESVQSISLYAPYNSDYPSIGNPEETVLLVEKSSYAYDWVTDPDGKYYLRHLRFKVIDQPITITFDSAGGNPVPPMSDVVGNSEIELPIPQREGYAFEGWYDGNGNRIVKFDTGYTYSRRITESITLYARWRRNAFTVTFDTDGGNAMPAITNVAEGSTIKQPKDPVKEGFTFLWWKEEDSWAANFNFSNKIYNDTTLRAIWEKNLTVTFDADGGSSVPPITNIKRGTVINKPKDPVKKGYVFSGWLNGFDGGDGIQDFSDKVNYDITLKAKWTKNKAKIEKCSFVDIGYTYKLKLSSNAPVKKVKWSSSNKKILKVTKKKKNSVTVEGLKNKKKATLKAIVTFQDGSKQTVKQKIRVKKKTWKNIKYPKGIKAFDEETPATYRGKDSDGIYEYFIMFDWQQYINHYRNYLVRKGYKYKTRLRDVTGRWELVYTKKNTRCKIYARQLDRESALVNIEWNKKIK